MPLSNRDRTSAGLHGGRRSAVEGVEWPSIPTGNMADRWRAVLRQLEQTQWQDADEILRRQLEQLRFVLLQAFHNVPFYRERLGRAGVDPNQLLDIESWRSIPILRRRDLQENRIRSQELPHGHGNVSYVQSSGSTGEPVKISLTTVNSFFWGAFTLRDHAWHQRDFSARFASIRAPNARTAPRLYENWGAPVKYLYTTGPAGSYGTGVDVSKQATWLREFNPGYLLTYPSNLQAIMDYCREREWRIPGLREIRTISETVSDDLRRRCLQEWGVPLTDTYSAQEVGYIALQCPQSPGYHVQSENVLVEILDDSGQPCAPGQVGRIVVSSLHNFSTPMIRYELRDMAEAGEPCSCGRGLPTIRRLLGRERNMLILPNGERRWPLTGYRRYEEVAPQVRQFQFIQRSLQLVEVRLVVSASLPGETESALIAHIQESLGHPFEIRLVYMDDIPRLQNGKFEEFISEVV